MEHFARPGRGRRFEDLVAWQKARALNRQVYRAARAEPLSNDYCLANQLRRASTSVMANLAEGFERGRRGEFHQFLTVAKGSCGEVRSLLYAAWDAKYLDKCTFAGLLAQAVELSGLIARLRSAVARQRNARDG